MDRVSILGDQRVIDALGGFVPVAQSTRFTQGYQGHDEHSAFFGKIAGQAPWTEASGAGNTAQGWYFFNAAGDLYAYAPFGLTTMTMDEILALIDKVKERHRHTPRRRLALPDALPQVQPTPPAGAIVARVYSRILPLPPGAPMLNRGVGRDFLWVLPAEIDEILSGRFPEALRSRLLLFHLWDNVRGEPDRWDPEHVRHASFRVEPLPGGTGGVRRVRLAGEFDLGAPAGRRGYRERDLPPAGYRGTLEGELAYDVASARVSAFTLVASGEAFGEGTFTGGAPPGRFPLQIAFVLAGDPVAREVAPQGVHWGLGEYLFTPIPPGRP